MGLLLFKPAYLEFLNEFVAQIVFPDGNTSQLLATKNQIFEVAESFLGISLTEEEIQFIKDQASRSNLRRNDPELEAMASETSNQMHELEQLCSRIRQLIEKENREGEEWKDGGGGGD